MTMYWVEGIVPPVLNVGTRWRWELLVNNEVKRLVCVDEPG
jgi:hypothetical protein